MSEKLLGFSVMIGVILGFLVGMHAHAAYRLRQLRADPPKLAATKLNFTFPKMLINAAKEAEKEDPTPPDKPPLKVGERCVFLYLAPPILTVVDADENDVVAAWYDGTQEYKFPRNLVRRYSSDMPARKPRIYVCDK